MAQLHAIGIFNLYAKSAIKCVSVLCCPKRLLW